MGRLLPFETGHPLPEVHDAVRTAIPDVHDMIAECVADQSRVDVLSGDIMDAIGRNRRIS